VLTSHPDRVDNELLMHFAEFREFREFRARSRSRPGNGGLQPISEVLSTEDLAPSATPEERIEAAYTEITNELRAAILELSSKGTPRFFEKLVVDLLTGMGYGGSRTNAGRQAGKAADGGIDGVINEDPLGLDSRLPSGQALRPGSTVGVDKVREFAGSLVERGATKGGGGRGCSDAEIVGCACLVSERSGHDARDGGPGAVRLLTRSRLLTIQSRASVRFTASAERRSRSCRRCRSKAR
jgi:restriction endonuclease Mrr